MILVFSMTSYQQILELEDSTCFWAHTHTHTQVDAGARMQGVTVASDVGETHREHAWVDNSLRTIITRKEREREEDRLSRLNTTVVLILWADRFRGEKNYWFGEEQPYCMDLWWNNKRSRNTSSGGNIQTSRSAKHCYSSLFCLIWLWPIYYLFILLFR